MAETVRESVAHAPDPSQAAQTNAWSVPAGATLLGSGKSVQVDFNGASAGNVSVNVNSSCESRPLKVAVFVEPDHAVEMTLDDFNCTSALTYNTITGVFNVAGRVLSYTRNSLGSTFKCNTRTI